jgi:hypothetical protein
VSAFVFDLDLVAIDAARISMPTSAPPDAPPHVRQLAADLADARPMRRGSLSERTIKCSKPGCACAKDPKACHGPYYSLTHAVRGKMHSRFLNIEQADLARQQIDAGREFRSRVDAYWEACETWADTQLDELAVSSEEAKKGAPSQPPKRNRPGSRSALRPTSGPRPGLRISGDSRPAAGFTAGCARSGTTAERGHYGSCRARTALRLRRSGSVSWPPREDLRKCTGAFASGEGLLSLHQMPEWILSAQSCFADGAFLAHTRRSADDRQRGGVLQTFPITR